MLPEQSTRGRRGGDSAGDEGVELQNPLSATTDILQGRAACTEAGFFRGGLLFLPVFTAVFSGEGNADEKPKGNVFISLKSNLDLGFNKRALFYLFKNNNK